MDTWEFLDRWFYPAQGWLEITFIYPREAESQSAYTGNIQAWWFNLPGDFDLLQAMLPASIQARNGAGFGVYFSLCLHHEPPPAEDRNWWQIRGTDTTAKTAPGLWADFDYEGDEQQKNTMADKLAACGHPPTLLTDSGGGLHGYWKFEEPMTLGTEPDKRYLRSLVRGVALTLDADTAVCNPSRVFRLPGFINTKPKRNGAPCVVLSCSDTRYKPADFEPYIEKRTVERRIDMPALPAELRGRLPKSVDDYIATGAPQGERNHRLFVAARHYNDNGMSVGEAERDLMPRASADGLTEREARTTIASAFKYAPGTPNLPGRMTHALAAQKALGGIK